MDGRRALPKSVAEALQLRVNALEALLKSRNIPFDEIELLSEVDKATSPLGDPEPSGKRRMSWTEPWRSPVPADTSDLMTAFGLDRLRVGPHVAHFADCSWTTVICVKLALRPASR